MGGADGFGKFGLERRGFVTGGEPSTTQYPQRCLLLLYAERRTGERDAPGPFGLVWGGTDPAGFSVTLRNMRWRHLVVGLAVHRRY